MNTIANLSIVRTSKTPSIEADASNGLLKISGRCVPENTIDFFLPLKNWISRYLEDPKPLTEVQIDLEYFNTSTSITLLNLLRLFEPLNSNGQEVSFIWLYENDDLDMKEAGEEYQLIIGHRFSLLAK